MSSRPKFLIVSNGRSGSTWLETMLGELPDIEVDYEFKWLPNYPPKPVHMVIPNEDFSCSQALEEISSTAPIVGSKLVLDPRLHTDEEYRKLAATIEEDIRVVHLTRNYADVFFSFARGAANILRNPNQGKESILYATLKNHTEDLRAEDNISNRLSGMADAPKKLLKRDNLKKLIQVRNLPKRIRNVLRLLKSEDKRRDISHDECVATMQVYLANDTWITRLKENRDGFMQIDYNEIPNRFADVVKFVGSTASAREIRQVLERPPTKKLPPIPPSELIKNADEVIDISQIFEAQKMAALRDQRG